MVLFLLLNKYVTMFSREGIEEKESFLLFPNCQLIFSLEVFIQLEEDLKASLKSLQAHIVCLLHPPAKVNAKDVPGGSGVYAWEDLIFIFPHDGCTVHRSSWCLLTFWCCTLHRPLSSTLTGWSFCREESVWWDTPFLHPNTCHSSLDKYSQTC